MADQYLSSLAQRTPPHTQQLLQEMAELHGKKLWFNITDKIEQFVNVRDLNAELLMEFYTQFLKEFELNLNLLRLSQIIVVISSKLVEGNQAIQFLEQVYQKIELASSKTSSSSSSGGSASYATASKTSLQQQSTETLEALVVLKVQIALWKLKMQDALSCKKILEEAKQLIDRAGNYVDNVVNATYHRARAEYFKVVDEPNEFYKSALLFLAYTPIEKIEHVAQQAIAFDLGIAALLGDQIYNFGELLGHPVIESLNGSQAEWLVKLLYAFNRGSIEEYKRVQQQYQQQIETRPVLHQRRVFLEEKMQLMSIMELVFTRPADNRTIPFADVAATIGAPLNQVEPLLLKALAYDLIRGVIDEVSQTVQVTWAQPRVLDKEQTLNLKNKIGSWLEKVDKTLLYLEEQGSDDLSSHL